MFKRDILWAGLILSTWSAVSVVAQDMQNDPAVDLEKTRTGQWMRYNEDEEALYQERFKVLKSRFSGASAEDVYDTLAKVSGAALYEPIQRHVQPRIDEVALMEAADYAMSRNSTAFIVFRDNAIEFEQYSEGVDSFTSLNSKSLAKPLGVIAVGAAIAKGYIQSVDQPVSDYITEWKGRPQQAILIRHILDMRSGLLPQDAASSAGDILNRSYLHPRHDEIIVNEYPMTHEPGERYEYSNANSELVAPLVERATGMDYELWISEEVLKPIGALGGTVWLNRHDGVAHAGCCIQLPAETWLRLGILVMQNGKWQGQTILTEEFVKEMTTPTPQNRFVGMTVWNGSEFTAYRSVMNPEKEGSMRYHSAPYLADDILMFDGNSNQVIYMVPSERLVILRMGLVPPRLPEWDYAFIPNTILRALGD